MTSVRPARCAANPIPGRAGLHRWGALVISLAFAGCSSPKQLAGAHGALWLSAADGPIGLSRVQPAPEFSFYLPASRQEASASFARDGAVGMMGTEATIIFPATALVGGIIGASLGIDAAARDRAAAAILEATRPMELEEALAGRLRAHLDGHGGLRDLPPNLPVDPPEVAGRLVREKSGRMVWERAAPPPHPAAGGEVQTVVHFHLWRQGLEATDPRGTYSGDATAPNPGLALVLRAEVAAIRVRDWTSLGGVTAVYRSLPHKFVEWAADDAALLRREMRTGLDELTHQLTREIFVDAGPRPRPEMPAGGPAHSTGDKPTTNPTVPP